MIMMSDPQRTEAEAFANQMQEVNETVLAAAVACNAEQWETTVLEEARSVGVVFHHIGYVYPFIVDWATRVASGKELPPVTRDMVHDVNQRHAEEHATVSQTDTATLLRENGAALVDWIRSLNDVQLKMGTPFALVGGKEISTRQVVEWFALNHAQNHLKAIQSTLE
jgi:uncharacterized damage-inducible protein DinB